MNSKIKHPDHILLDQLRAGLLDDQVQLKAELGKHLQHCELCRQATDWKQIADRTTVPAHLDSRLEAIRKSAMHPAPRRTSSFIPIAAAASVIALLTASLLFITTDMTTDSATIQAQATPVDIYEDLDFYLWMADHTAEDGQSTQNNDQQS